MLLHREITSYLYTDRLLQVQTSSFLWIYSKAIIDLDSDARVIILAFS